MQRTDFQETSVADHEVPLEGRTHHFQLALRECDCATANERDPAKKEHIGFSLRMHTTYDNRLMTIFHID